eukprot:1159478-Pelagomonas_calceolata.AAC.7
MKGLRPRCGQGPCRVCCLPWLTLQTGKQCITVSMQARIRRGKQCDASLDHERFAAEGWARPLPGVLPALPEFADRKL